MKSWSDIRRILEQDRLAPVLRGRVQYFITSYHNAHDQHGGRIAIRIDGEEVFRSSVFEVLDKEQALYRQAKDRFPELSVRERWRKTLDLELSMGLAEDTSMYRAFREYDTQPIEQSLTSDNALVRVLAILDRRIGKRRLTAIREQGFLQEPEWVQTFYRLRLEAEGLISPARE